MKQWSQIFEKRWYYHSILWGLALLFVFTFMNPTGSGFNEKILHTSVLIIPSVILAYSIFFLQDLLLVRKRYVLFIVSGSLAIFGTGYFAVLLGAHLYGVEIEDMEINQWIQNMFFIAIIVLLARIAKKGIMTRLELQRLQVEKFTIELEALKSQLNSHFLFNTINNICGVNQIDAEKGTEMLIHLSELLRYHLEFSEEQRILLSKEIQLITSYIALERMRLRSNCDVVFRGPKNDMDVLIAPLLLLPFVENAFKHGTHFSKDCFIHIDMIQNTDSITLRVENSVFDVKKIDSNGIGTSNTIKRLELVYPEKYDLKIDEQQGRYLVTLRIDL